MTAFYGSWKTLSDKGTPTRCIKVIQDMYERARTCVRTPTGNTEYYRKHRVLPETLEGLNGRLEQWRKALEDNGLRVNREKTKYLRCNFSRNENGRNEEEEIRIGEHILEPKVATRPTMLYGSECWPLTKVQANRIKVAEMRMLMWTYGKTILDMLPNGYRQQDERRTIEMVRACQEKTTYLLAEWSR
ncbi:hypothetical protein Tco_0022814 [Tanacetum coccineum]